MDELVVWQLPDRGETKLSSPHSGNVTSSGSVGKEKYTLAALRGRGHSLEDRVRSSNSTRLGMTVLKYNCSRTSQKKQSLQRCASCYVLYATFSS